MPKLPTCCWRYSRTSKIGFLTKCVTVFFKLIRPTILKEKTHQQDHTVPFLAFFSYSVKGSLICWRREGKALIDVQFCRDVISKAVSHPAIRKMADILRAETKNTTCTVNTLKKALRLASLVFIAKCKVRSFFTIDFYNLIS